MSFGKRIREIRSRLAEDGITISDWWKDARAYPVIRAVDPSGITVDVRVASSPKNEACSVNNTVQTVRRSIRAAKDRR